MKKTNKILVFAITLMFILATLTITSFAVDGAFNVTLDNIVTINKSNGYFVALRFFYDDYEESYYGQISVLTKNEFLNEFEWLGIQNLSQLELYINEIYGDSLDRFVDDYAITDMVSEEIANQLEFYVNNVKLDTFTDLNEYKWFVGFITADSYILSAEVNNGTTGDQSPITTMFQEVKNVFMPLTEYVDEQVVDIMLYLLFVSLVYFIVIRNLFRLFGSTKCIQVADTIFIALCIGAVISTLGINLIGVINNV